MGCNALAPQNLVYCVLQNRNAKTVVRHEINARAVHTMINLQHEPLREPQSIRTLTLLPAKDPQEPLRCELKEIPFKNGCKARYEAVSYAWGAPSLDNFVLCHGKRLPITENCEAALKRLRKPSKTRTLWVDSICIDQSSMVERSDQVKLMGSIYRQATRVSDRARRRVIGPWSTLLPSAAMQPRILWVRGLSLTSTSPVRIHQ